jgi:hypothetical protein
MSDSEPTWNGTCDQCGEDDGGDFTACEHCEGLFCAVCIEWCCEPEDDANGAWLCEDCRK